MARTVFSPQLNTAFLLAWEGVISGIWVSFSWRTWFECVPTGCRATGSVFLLLLLAERTQSVFFTGFQVLLRQPDLTANCWSLVWSLSLYGFIRLSLWSLILRRYLPPKRVHWVLNSTKGRVCCCGCSAAAALSLSAGNFSLIFFFFDNTEIGMSLIDYIHFWFDSVQYKSHVTGITKMRGWWTPISDNDLKNCFLTLCS